MNIPTKYGLNRVLPPLMTAGLVTLAVLAATNSSAGIQGSGLRSLLAIGTVTETGNGHSNIIVVGGIPYSTSRAAFKIDGHAGLPAQIHTGDVVSLIATDPADGGTAAATQVAFEGSVQGKVSDIDAPSSTLFILGQTVHVTSQTVFGSNIQPGGLLGLQSGAVVEVSGFANSVGELVATLIEAKGQSNVARVAGSVQTLNQIQHTFYVNSLKIDYGNAHVDAVLTDGAPVTVQGVKFGADGALIANLVRAAGVTPGQPDSLGRIQGLITSYSSGAYFEVNGQPVSVGAQTKLNLPVPIGVDVEVNVTGTFDTNGVLVADSVQTSK
ncbi:MAG: hypothetical protein QOI59_4778 [Gammaproteobacteria bacterium]|nr:hypothetical protein [Gammaproteobacteria bacterium]